MKVMLVNGSPHQLGCTHRALAEVAGALEQEGIDTEIFWIGAPQRRLHRLRRVSQNRVLRAGGPRERVPRASS